jgi:hypothetical protein
MAAEPADMTRAYGEDHWYGKHGWRRLRGPIVSLAIQQSDTLFEALRLNEEDPLDCARAFVSDLIIALNDRSQGVLREAIESEVDHRAGLTSSRWAFALPLFADVDALASRIAKEAHVLSGRTNRPVEAKAALGQIIRRFLESARRALSDATEHEAKTWEMIDRLSLDVQRRNLGTPTEHRCSDEHLQALLSEFSERHPGNHNLPRRLAKLREYFDTFCPDCEERNQEELLVLQQETGITLPIELCLGKLKAESEPLWEVIAVAGEMEEMAGLTQEAYLAQRNLTRYAFGKRLREAQALMQRCLEDSIEFQLRRFA